MAFVELLRAAPKRTLSDLLRKLPNHGVGAIVTRDTWHPESKKYWEVVEVAPSPVDSTKLNAWGFQYYKGVRQNPAPKRIASVWKYGWLLQEQPGAGLSAAVLQQLAERQAAAAGLVAGGGGPGAAGAPEAAAKGS
ncbi:hypothetical protein HYH02_007255 [Chlamydomonas schloesseri]|uniref:Uncharacterized protein n=1 Tax=Chlamydomonas schloesseri TaxID=2026947 RepID=A0A835WI79_9CHLO|nr:hypothetical protein HYH02_007255 [Chlamydomonas schloesseri]|eukprot:KAG2447798.1 hypothetical protein HYH02_007255 [Chlamydomonas schloesseri]